MLIDALHAALEDAEEAFDGVGMKLRIVAVHIFKVAVVDGAVSREIPPKRAIRTPFVGHQVRVG